MIKCKSETTQWDRQIGAEMVQDSKATTRGRVASCKIETQYQGWVKADSMPHNCGGREVWPARCKIWQHEVFKAWVTKWGAQLRLGVVAFQWLVGGKAKAQGRWKGWGAVACHHRHSFFGVHWCISAFCLDEGSCQRISVLYTHINEFSNFYFLCIYLSKMDWISNFIIRRHT